MKSKDISKKYGLDGAAFDSWLKKSSYTTTSGRMGGIDVSEDGQDINDIVRSFNAHAEQERARWAREEAERRRAITEEREASERAAREKREALAGMLITSGFSFDGFRITKYSGYISGDDALSINRSSGWLSTPTDVSAKLMESLVTIRRNALAELKEAAFALGCNAVIGVDFDYITLDPETASGTGGTVYLPYVFGVTANGNAVIIERSDRNV